MQILNRTIIILFFVCSLAVSAPDNLFAQTRPPNIVLIVADDLGFGELGCYGQKWIKTPRLDQLAAQGMRFRQFYSGQAVCAPSRCSLLTGFHQGHAYIRNNGNPPDRKGKGGVDPLYFPGQNPIPGETETIAEVLKRQGYATAAIGKWGLGYEGSSGDPNRQGFDLFYGFNCQRHAHNHYPRFLWNNDRREILPGNNRSATGDTYSQDRFREMALQFVDQNRDQPFFLYLPFAIPHLAIQVPAASLEKYGKGIPEQEHTHRGYIPHPRPRAGYAAMVSHMDRDIGIILDRIQSLGLEEDTIVMFTSDNGPAANRLGGTDSTFFESSGGLRGRKGSLFEGGIRVPLIVKWPGKTKPGSETDHIAAFWDVFATVVQMSGGDSDVETDGISFVPELTGQPQPTHQYLYWEFPGYGGQQALRWGNYKAIRRGLIKDPNAPLMLFDLRVDPAEQKDIAADHPEKIDRIRNWLATAREPSQLFPFPALDSDSEE